MPVNAHTESTDDVEALQVCKGASMPEILRNGLQQYQCNTQDAPPGPCLHHQKQLEEANLARQKHAEERNQLIVQVPNLIMEFATVLLDHARLFTMWPTTGSRTSREAVRL
eukprot:scaffold21287_cov22-Tisochrysis_lutea.AAC.1